MITYDRSAFGLNLLFRIHGSAAWRGIIPGLFSIAFVFLFRWIEGTDDIINQADGDIDHPYAVGIVVGALSALLVFRVNQGYARYWEAAGAIHHMMSKWMDATIHTACYHMQCAHYDSIKPPSFFDYPELNAYFLTRDRERWYDVPKDERVLQDLDDGKLPDIAENTTAEVHSSRRKLEEEINKQNNHTRRASTHPHNSSNINNIHISTRSGASHQEQADSIMDRAYHKSIEAVHIHDRQEFSDGATRLHNKYGMDTSTSDWTPAMGPIPLSGKPRLDGGWGKLFPDKKATFFQPEDSDPSSPNYLDNLPSFASTQGGRTPSLFLQELAHLCSLLTAVALSSLRRDKEGSVAPLGVFKPGAPWPEVDPDQMDDGFLKGPIHTQVIRYVKNFLGSPRPPEERTRYNAARPLDVIGGVSDAEIRFLQMARGPYAKTQLCWNWITEFIIREHLNGSTGKVGPPIISRIIQFLGDGMIFYNHARKIMFIPFPFPHAQLSAMMVVVSVPLIAFLMNQYAENAFFSALLSFCAVFALAGMNEVARELENPFRNIPNELPLVTLMAQFNEALITMYAGYHPDLFWDPKIHNHHPSEPPPRGSRRANSKSRKERSSTASPNMRRSKSAGSNPGPEVILSSKLAEKVPSPNSSSHSDIMPNNSNHGISENDPAKAEIAKLTSQLEDSGKEIKRLRGLVQSSEEKKDK